jgi:predicted dehydrogenase
LIEKIQQTATLVMIYQGATHDNVSYFLMRFRKTHPAEIRDFISDILEDRPPGVIGHDARQATTIGIAATLSLDKGHPVIVS